MVFEEKHMLRKLLTLIVAASVGQLDAQARPGSTASEWFTLANAEMPAISPDGGSVVYRINRANLERQAAEIQMWLVTIATGEQGQLGGTENGWAMAWSPDGNRIAFLSSQKGGTQVYVTPARGGQPIQVTNAPNGVDSYRWSPDGTRIAYVSGEPVPRPDSANVSQSKDFRVLGREGYYSASLFVVALPTEGSSTPPQAERITKAADFAVDDAFSWSPDSKRIAFSASDYTSNESFWTHDIHVVSVADKAPRRIVATRGPQFFPLWSPDGREVGFKTFVLTDRDDYRLYSIGYVATVSAEGGPVRVLTGEFDENLTPLAWGPDGIYFFARVRAYSHLYRVIPATRVVERVTQPATAIKTSFSFSRDFKQVAFLGEDSAKYQEVYAAPTNGTARPKQLTRMGDQLRGWAIGTREVVNWTSPDGTPIEGILIKPAGFDPARKYPLLVTLHTGPLEADQPTVEGGFRDFPYVPDLYTMRGFVVLRPNYRGSIGYGAGFRAALVRNQGLPQYHDVISGVDHLIAQGFIDSTRVFGAGWSAGAYPVAFGSVWENRFRAVSLLEAGLDWRMFYTLGGGGVVRPDYAQATPWDDPDYYRVTSVVTYIKRATTPTLIQHGEQDRTAPIHAAYELYRGLKDHGVPVRMVVFPRMGHVPNTYGQAIAIMEQNLEWFDYWMKNTPPRRK
jgi:dipeptidyl aminopeptidase/acylaminoacyl peptidase